MQIYTKLFSLELQSIEPEMYSRCYFLLNQFGCSFPWIISADISKNNIAITEI